MVDPRRAIGTIGRQIQIRPGRDPQARIERPVVLLLRETEEALIEVDRSLQIGNDNRHVVEAANLQLRPGLRERVRRGEQRRNRHQKAAAIDGCGHGAAYVTISADARINSRAGVAAAIEEDWARDSK